MKIEVITAEDIYRLVAEKKFSQSWLAEQIGMTAQAFNKMLLHGKDIPTETQKKLNDVFRKEGIISDKKEQCSLLIKQTLHTNSIINQSLSSLNELTIKLAGDEDLNFDDKKTLIEQYENMIEEAQNKIYELIRLVKGKR